MSNRSDEPTAHDELRALRKRVSELEDLLEGQRDAAGASCREEKLESLSVLAGGIAHDFNNLLGGMLNYATLAMSRIDGAIAQGANESSLTSARKAIENAQVAGRRMAELAKQMLIYSGRGHVLIEPVDLSALINESRRLLEEAAGEKARIRFNLSEDLPLVDADASQLREVASMLVANAVESLVDTREGGIDVTTLVVEVGEVPVWGRYAEGPPAEGHYVALEVSDNGQGMTPETLDRIFDPFFSTKATGRGLGLSTVLGSARGHSGAVAVTSEPGVGSTLRVLLPVVSTPG